MTAKKKGPPRVVLDAVAFDIAPRSTCASVGDILREGTADEMRGLIGWLGQRLYLNTWNNHPRIPPVPDQIREWLGYALEAISCGKDPKVALGLNRKTKHGPQHRNILAYQVDKLVAQGVTRSEAESAVGNYDPETQSFAADPDDKAATRIRKVISRKARTK